MSMKPLKGKRCLIRVLKYEGFSPPIPVLQYGEYLAVHRDLYRGLPCDWTDWNITHTPTGLRIRGGYTTRRDAIAAVALLIDLDWTQADSARCYEFHKQVRELLGPLSRPGY